MERFVMSAVSSTEGKSRVLWVCLVRGFDSVCGVKALYEEVV